MNKPASLFDARKQRYEQAISAFASWFLSEPRNNGDYQESVIGDLSLLDVLDALQSELLATPALSVADVVYKLELSIREIDDVCSEPSDYASRALLNRARVALHAGSLETARRLVNKALAGETDYPTVYEGAAAALADLQRLSA